MIKVERTFPAPASLAIEKEKNGTYRGDDVVKQLNADFYSKCYLCEMKPVYDINVEHLNPHKGDMDLKFDWENLFYSCVHCNNIKNQRKYDAKILDCCKNDPEDSLYHFFYDDRVEVKPMQKFCTDETICLTAELITSCFEYRNTGMRTIQCQARIDDLKIVMLSLYKNLEKYLENPSGQALNVLRAMLSRTYKFAGFTRTYVKTHLNDYPNLAQYIL